jgi:GNAT superfamily N-acetyltransferase
VSTSDGLVARIEAYYDAAPRSAADAEDIGAFTLFVGRGPWAYYARPRLGLSVDVTARDVHELLDRQRELDVPTEIEWQPAAAPSLAQACTKAGMTVHTFPVMVHAGPAPDAAQDVRLLRPGDDVADVLATQQHGFGAPAEVDDAAAAHLRALVASGHTRVAVAPREADPICVGMHNPLAQVSEVVGVATVPPHRRQGWAGQVIRSLVADAYALGVETVFLSAATDDVAHVYERVGFTTVGTVCAAEIAGP